MVRRRISHSIARPVQRATPRGTGRAMADMAHRFIEDGAERARLGIRPSTIRRLFFTSFFPSPSLFFCTLFLALVAPRFLSSRSLPPFACLASATSFFRAKRWFCHKLFPGLFFVRAFPPEFHGTPSGAFPRFFFC
jgi:hypothetical protein